MNRQRWEIPFSEPRISNELLSAGYNRLLASVLTTRGIKTVEQAEALLGDSVILGDPLKMKDMDKARDRLLLAIENHEAVAVYGDYDVDGITASCLLTSYLKSKGLDCHMHIPDREEEGYGLNKKALDAFKAMGISLVVTVDCGITAVDEALYAKQIGIDLVITDHHECPGDILPDAAAVVDYKRPDDEYEYKILAGVGVAFKLVCACEGTADTVIEEYSDLVAIGTVADVMPLVGENRYLVKKGLQNIKSNPRVGISSMMKRIPSSMKEFTENSISFSLAPRLNAAGRMGQASTAAKLLAADNEDIAKDLAAELDTLNEERKEHEKSIWYDALNMLEGSTPDAPLVLSSPDWHPGVIGIVASRLSEKYKLPAVIICPKKDAEVAKGSCRSFGGFNLHDALSSCKEYLVSFGGHALAAGLSIEKGMIDDFREALGEYYKRVAVDTETGVKCDLLILDEDLLSVENVKSLSGLSPFGAENEKPKFCMYGVTAENISKVGTDGKHLKARVRLGKTAYDCIYFSPEPETMNSISSMKPGDCVDIIFTPQINEYRNNESVQLSIQEMRAHDSRELCSAITGNFDSCFYAASKYCPDNFKAIREECLRAWEYISKLRLIVGSSVDEILNHIPDNQSPELFCVCLMVLLEIGIIKSDDNNGVFGAHLVPALSKRNLQDSHIVRSLQK